MSYTLSAIPSFGTGAWTGSGTFSPSANDPNATVTVLNPGSFTYIWTEDNTLGCTDFDNVIISFSNLSYIDNVVQSTCGNPDGEIELVASNGVAPLQYSIDNGNTFQSGGLFTGLLSGTYDVVIIDDLGCQVTGQIIVTDQGGPVINSIIGVDVNCFGGCDGDIVINATGATLFSIDNGLTFQALNTFNSICAGTYDVVVEDNNGCQDIDQVVINEPTLLTTNFLTVDPLCFGDCTGEIDFSPSGGTSSYQYSIDNGVSWSVTSLFTGLCAGNYDLIVQDDNGCQTTPQAITILEPPLLSMILGVTNETCFGACDGMINSIPSGGTGPGTYTYNWTPSLGASPLIANLCTGSYSLTVADANGCTVIADTVIAGPQAVTIDNIITTNELCGGDCMGSISINATGANQFSLDGVNYQPSNTYSNLCAGSYTIYVQDASGCLSTDTTSITGPSPLAIQAFNDTIICVGGTAQLSALCSGGAGGYVYNWDNGSQAQNIAVSPINDQIYCVTGVDQNGCSSNQLCLTVSVNPDLSILAFSDQLICLGDSTRYFFFSFWW